MMTESKIELTHRLQREDRWNEASEFRDKVRREQREAGKTRLEANETAWNRMAEEFPPLAMSQTSADAMDDPFSDVNDSDLPADLSSADSEFESDLLWAYRHICSEASRDDAPSGAAWVLRQWARDPATRDKFLNFVAKTQYRNRDSEERLKDDGRRQFELLSLFGPMNESDGNQHLSRISAAEALDRLSKLPRETMIAVEMPVQSANRPVRPTIKRDFLNEPVD